MVKVKICGITNLKDALQALAAGADALGFVFYKKSPRYIAPEDAGKIIRRLPKSAIKIGVFVNAREKSIKRIAGICGLNILQFHGNESPEFCSRFKGYKIIKALRVKAAVDKPKILKYKPYAYLFDTWVSNKAGGTGERFNWSLLENFSKIGRRVFLSGGLNAANVKQAINIVHPDWVDTSSGVEARPGKKDARKLKKFIQAVKNEITG